MAVGEGAGSVAHVQAGVSTNTDKEVQPKVMQLWNSVQIESFWPVQGQSWAVGSDSSEPEEIPVVE